MLSIYVSPPMCAYTSHILTPPEFPHANIRLWCSENYTLTLAQPPEELPWPPPSVNVAARPRRLAPSWLGGLSWGQRLGRLTTTWIPARRSGGFELLASAVSKWVQLVDNMSGFGLKGLFYTISQVLICLSATWLHRVVTGNRAEV